MFLDTSSIKFAHSPEFPLLWEYLLRMVFEIIKVTILINMKRYVVYWGANGMKKKNEMKPIVTTPFQTIREAVRSTGLSERYMRKLHSEGKLPHVMSGNRVLVNVPKLMEMMDKVCVLQEY